MRKRSLSWWISLKDRVENWITCHRINKLFMSTVEMEGLIEIHRYDTILSAVSGWLGHERIDDMKPRGSIVQAIWRRTHTNIPSYKRDRKFRRSLYLWSDSSIMSHDTKFHSSYFAFIHAGCLNLFACWQKKLKIHLWQLFCQILYLIYVYKWYKKNRFNKKIMIVILIFVKCNWWMIRYFFRIFYLFYMKGYLYVFLSRLLVQYFPRFRVVAITTRYCRDIPW